MMALKRSLALVVLSATSVRAQNPPPAPLPDIIIPPPPVQKGAPGKPDHQARMTKPGFAYDDVTGRHLYWDCRRKTWIEQSDKNAEIGYDGFTGENGEIIPPPGYDSKTGAVAKQSSANPAHAVDAKSGLDLQWDAETHVWKDTKTGREIAGKGWIVKHCPDDLPIPRFNARTGELEPVNETNAQVQIGIDYEHRNYFNWRDVPRIDPSVSSSSGTSSTNGIGGSVGIKFEKIGRFQVISSLQGYYASGLKLDAGLANGQSVRNDVKDYGIGIGFRVPFNQTGRIAPYIELGALYQTNRSQFSQYNRANSLIHSEDRSTSSWTGHYAAGALYMIRQAYGINIGGSYNGRFKKQNADENWALIAGIRANLGPH